MRRYTLFFDGGVSGEQQWGYGSYVIVGPDGKVLNGHEALTFGPHFDNTRAEFLALLKGVEALRKHLQRQKIDARSCALIIYGDNEAVLGMAGGNGHAQSLRITDVARKVRRKLSRFGQVQVERLERQQIKAMLGH